MGKVTVKIGFVPSYRFRYTPWCQKMRDDSLAAFAKVPGMQVVVPQDSPDGATLDPVKGFTPHGMVHSLDEAETTAEYFRSQHVDGVILCPLDFGDERSAVKVAERLGVPVMLYATKEPPAPDDSGLTRVSDSYCGNLSMASGLYRRKIAFRYAGLFFPDEPAFLAEVKDFVGAVAVVKGMKNARLGQVGVRPPTFETVGYDEAALIRSFGQNIIYSDLGDMVARAKGYKNDDERVQKIVADITGSVVAVTVATDYVLNAAKLELALSEFWKEAKLSAMAMQCWPSVQQALGISVCNVYGRLTNQGMLTACEADILGAASMLVNYQAALGATVPHFIDWTIRHRENPNQLLAWHCGNAPVSLAADPKTDGAALAERHEGRAARRRRRPAGRLGAVPDQARQGHVLPPGRIRRPVEDADRHR